MLNKLLQNKWNIVLVMVLVSMLVLVRAFEDQLFYDPFLDYFKADFNALPLPKFNSFELIL